MRNLLIPLGGVLILVFANVGIYQNQQLLASGRVVLLQLAPVDPRSLMQGDYMALRFKVANDAFGNVPRDTPHDVHDGRLVLKVDDRNVGSFERFDDGQPIGPQEVLLRYRMRGAGNRDPKFATNGYFFQEGTADRYSTARFGEFRVSPSGEAILTAMRNDKLERLGP